jgi:DNA-binding transcriptional ArsR family regulator
MPAGPDSADVFAALGEPTRRSIVELLSKSGPLTATTMAHEYDLTRQALVKHLGVLAEAGIVVSERHGNEVRYSVVPQSLNAAVSWLESVGSVWDRRIVALNKRLRRTESS